MPSPLAEKLGAFLRGGLGLTLVALSGIAGSVSVAYSLRRAELLVLEQDIERRVTLRHDLLRESLRAYESALFALRLLVENSDSLTRAEFEQAAAQIITRAPGLQAVQWAPIIRNEELADFFTRTRDTAHPDFELRQMGSNGKLEPLSAAPRTDYIFITYAYPLAPNLPALGYDILTSPSAPTLARARALPGEPSLSAPFPIVQGGTGIVLAASVRSFSHEAAPPLGGPGIIQLVLRLDDALNRVWNLSPNSILDVTLVDATQTEPIPLYRQLAGQTEPSGPPASATRSGTPSDALVHNLAIGGRVWRATYQPKPGWISSRISFAPLLSLLGSLTLTGVILAYLLLLRRRHSEIRSEVALRTAELAENRVLLESIIDHNPNAIWVKGADHRYLVVNRRLAASHSLAKEEIVGRDDELLHPPAVARAMREVDDRILASGGPLTFEASYRMPGGMRTYIVSKFPIHAADGSVRAVAGIATDITDLRDAEVGRASAERRLQESRKLESLGILAGGVAHDFNNILTGILGHASLSRAVLPPADPVQGSLAQIETAVQRAAELCRQMLAYSGRGRLSVRPTDLATLVRETADLLRLSLSPLARLTLDLAPSLPPVVADLTQLRQIIMNLVLNAVESLGDKEGGVAVHLALIQADSALFARCLHEPQLPPGPYLQLTVADTGSGMSPETLARIFDPFFSTKFTGRGLGLAAVLGIVRGHSGAIQVHSRPGHGTTFHLYLPAAPQSVSPPSAPSPATAPKLAEATAPSRLSSPSPRRLLFVDDEASIRDTAAPLLRSIGYQVDCAPDGETGLALFKCDPAAYVVAIVDLTMPGMGGIELLREFRILRPDFPVLLISGYSEHDTTRFSTAHPQVAFLSKPFTLSSLQVKLDALLAPSS